MPSGVFARLPPDSTFAWRTDMPIWLKRLAAVMFVSILAACGGSDGYTETAVAPPPPLPVPASSYTALSLVADNAATPAIAVA